MSECHARFYEGSAVTADDDLCHVCPRFVFSHLCGRNPHLYNRVSILHNLSFYEVSHLFNIHVTACDLEYLITAIAS